MFVNTLVFILNLLLIPHLLIAADEKKQFNHNEIIEARFGEESLQELIQQTDDVEKKANNKIIGQSDATALLGAKVDQYLTSYSKGRNGPPIAQHFIGFPGVGKSGLAGILEEYFPVVRVDAQNFVDPQTINQLKYSLAYEPKLRSGKPVVLLIEEIDKLREVTPGQPEKTSPFIGMLNEILNSGRSSLLNNLDLSNVLVITTMNLPPELIEEFSEKVLGKKKSYYDFSIADFKSFHQWLLSNPGAIPDILSRMFRTNTVGRLAPNMYAMKHFTKKDYLDLIRLTLDTRINELLGDSKMRLELQYSESVLKYLYKRSVNPAMGARETIVKTLDFIEQIISISSKLVFDDKIELARPRKVFLNTKKDKIILNVENLKRARNSDWVTESSHKLSLKRNDLTGVITKPDQVVKINPEDFKQYKSDKVSKTDVLNARFPKHDTNVTGVEKAISSVARGQEDFAKYLREEMERYLSSPVNSLREPKSSVFAGFPGIGKSLALEIVAKYLKLPIARVNMQAFSSSSEESSVKFLDTLIEEVEKAKQKAGKRGKYILILEEIDKVNEIDPMGNPKDRPVVTMLKDLIDRGHTELTTKGDYSSMKRSIDVRDAYVSATMNFNGKIFDFKADPRLTTISDMISAWEQLAFSKASAKEALESIFRPETISRILPRLKIVKPPEESDYKQIIKDQIAIFIKERFLDKDGRNIAKIDLKAQKSYLDYLFKEAIIPSEGPRYTADRVKYFLGRDLESALKALPKEWRSSPVTISLSFTNKESKVTSSIRLKDTTKSTKLVKSSESVPLHFPSLRNFGKLSPKKILTTVHELGHGYTAVKLGLRIERVVVNSPTPGIGGYVKYGENGNGAQDKIALIYSAVASRAFERIFLSKNPLESRSTLDITSGSSSDITSATEELNKLINVFGLNPHGGSVDRHGGHVKKNDKHSDFAEIPQDEVLRLGRVLRKMENFVVKEMLEANSIDWYKEKVIALAKNGEANEAEFYRLLGLEPPRGELALTDTLEALVDRFKSEIDGKYLASYKQGKQALFGSDNMSANEVRKKYFEHFLTSVEEVYSDKNLCRKAFQ